MSGAAPTPGHPDRCSCGECAYRSRITSDDLPMGGCRTWRIHYAHLAAGDPRCENQRDDA